MSVQWGAYPAEKNSHIINEKVNAFQLKTVNLYELVLRFAVTAARWIEIMAFLTVVISKGINFGINLRNAEESSSDATAIDGKKCRWVSCAVVRKGGSSDGFFLTNITTPTIKIYSAIPIATHCRGGFKRSCDGGANLHLLFANPQGSSRPKDKYSLVKRTKMKCEAHWLVKCSLS